jgi:hypothetical protein
MLIYTSIQQLRLFQFITSHSTPRKQSFSVNVLTGNNKLFMVIKIF